MENSHRDRIELSVDTILGVERDATLREIVGRVGKRPQPCCDEFKPLYLVKDKVLWVCLSCGTHSHHHVAEQVLAEMVVDSYDSYQRSGNSPERTGRV